MRLTGALAAGMMGLLAALATACATMPERADAPAVPPRSADATERRHVVSRGETLYAIARRYGVSVDELARVNGITNPARIQAGQLLSIPGPSGADAADEAPGAPSAAPPPSWAWPIQGSVRSRFGARAHGDWHTGIDLDAASGVEIRAAADGEVSFAGQQGRYGRLVVINHGGGWTTWYAHLQDVLVARGQVVRQGEAIGAAGSTGNATGPHLHFEVRLAGRPIDPLTVLP